MESAAIFPGSEQLALPQSQMPEETPEQKALAQLPAGHPLLARAQEALKQQLSATKLRLEEELREKQNILKAGVIPALTRCLLTLQKTDQKREDVGVELYGYQQQLAKLQLGFEKAQDQCVVISKVRRTLEEQLNQLKKAATSEIDFTQKERQKVDDFQSETDKLAASLKNIEKYNEEMKGEIAVTKRATYAAEQAVQTAEKGKKEQDFLIEALHAQIRAQQSAAQLNAARYTAQQHETRAARELLTEAASDMETVNFEKKGLLAQWQASLLGLQRRDEALQAAEDAIRQVQEQEREVQNETAAFKRQTARAEVEGQRLAALLDRASKDAQQLQGKADAMHAKQEMIKDTQERLQQSLIHTEKELQQARIEGKSLQTDRSTVEKECSQVAQEIKAFEQQILERLRDQTTAEKGAQKAATDTQRLRKAVAAEEMRSLQVQNDLARTEVDIVDTESRKSRLQEAVTQQEGDLQTRMESVAKAEAAIKRTNGEIERRTKEIVMLNRKYEKLVANMEPGEHVGPLEATINNLIREIARKGDENRDLQRRWMSQQLELIGLQTAAARDAEALQQLRAEHSVLSARRARLLSQQENTAKDVKQLEKKLTGLHADMGRFNALIATHKELQTMLSHDAFNLERRIANELQGLEEESASIQSNIDQGHEDKRSILADIVKAEREVMLWERKIQLKREMQAALDPTVGADVVGAMQKEVHRMQLRQNDLALQQEKLLNELERGIAKRDTISIKGRATEARNQPELTEATLKRSLADMERKVKETRRQLHSLDAQLSELDMQRTLLVDHITAASQACGQARQQEGILRASVEASLTDKHKALLLTTAWQKATKRLEEAAAGKYKIRADPAAVEGELNKAFQKEQEIRAAVQHLSEVMPEHHQALKRVLFHSSTAVPVPLAVA
ncbi:hypothetical protein WJX74_006086 [Apatococcus lobatus]|uniref:Coiled-coil domain-containing protein 40 n=1 Tax=Apatococcus lobatus TaxID=904363 RepID=A0AAW1QJB9_9CHLO